jgi:hypothetical protein
MSKNLTDRHVRIARHRIVAAANLLLANPRNTHYTMGAGRWSGIANHKTFDGRILPFFGDCSSTATWMLWLALHVPFNIEDVVNGAGWRAGFTGTMTRHGTAVSAFHDGRVGDCIFYGGSLSVPEHVAIKIAPGIVFSHGSEAGPFRLAVGYRSDVHSQARRYFH